MSCELGGAPAASNVTVWSSGSELTQRTIWPAPIVIESAWNLICAIRTVAAAAPRSPAAAGFAPPPEWNHGAKRLKWMGMVNSKPQMTLAGANTALRFELLSMVFTATLLACSDNVCGEPGMRTRTPALHAAFWVESGVTNEATSPATAT